MNRNLIALLVVCGCLLVPRHVEATPAAVASSVGKAVLKYFGKEGSAEATEYMAKQGGKEVVERVTSNAIRQGGDEAVQQAARLASKHGPDALAALDNVPSVVPILPAALDELPESQVKTALVSLSAGKGGRELAETVSRFGVTALRSELQHPGVGMVLVRALGDDGAALARRLSSDQAITLGRHVDDIAKLPASQRAGVLGMLRNDTDRMLSFVGGFVEANPGKSLFTVAATTVILAQPERILGGDQVVFDEEGNPIVVAKAGLVGRSMDAGGKVASHVSQQYLRPIFFTVVAFAGTLAVIWSAIKIWQFRVVKRAALKRVASRE